MTYSSEPADIGAAAAAEHAARRCPTHDCIIDDIDPCDFCQADAAEDCPACDGAGVTVTTHPQWGQLNCPAPELETRCNNCDAGQS